MRVKLKTLGCRLNEAELETWAQKLQLEGHLIVPEEASADLIILNSCAVTQDAVKKSRYLIRRTHRENPQAKIVVTGCYATLNSREACETLGVDLVISNTDKPNLLQIAKETLNLSTMPTYATEPGEASLFAIGRQRAFIKVQDGCRYRCTFCIVTMARGEERSRPIQDIIDEINILHDQGIQEAVLTGVHLGGYGSDVGLSLPQLISALISQTKIPRIRIGSLEPWELTDAFFELLQSDRLMPHLHLPLQSGSDSVLRRMARRCNSKQFAYLVDKVRLLVPDINITTDVIVGFPGESSEEWQENIDFLEQMEFGHIHIFSYSKREGTKASLMPDQIPDSIKKERSQFLQRMAAFHRRKFLQRHIGRPMPILWEGHQETLPNGSHRMFGYLPNYLRAETIAEPRVPSPCGSIVSATCRSVSESGDFLHVNLNPNGDDATPSGPAKE